MATKKTPRSRTASPAKPSRTAKPAPKTSSAAAPKTKPTSKAPAPRAAAPKASPTRSASGAAASDSIDLSVLGAISAQLPALSEAERRAFASRFSAAQCDEQGTRTKAAGVLGDALRWLGPMNEALKAYPQDLRRYGVRRFAWFVECVGDLADVLELSGARMKRTGGVRSVKDRAVERARALRDELGDTLAVLAGGDEERREELDEALRSIEGPQDLIDTLGALEGIARDWLGREDEESRALVASVSLGEGDLEAVRAAVGELKRTAGDAKLSPTQRTNDPPEVNRIEGRVVLEMKLAQSLFEAAHARNRLVPRLIPGAATRHELLRRRGGERREEAPAEETATSETTKGDRAKK